MSRRPRANAYWFPGTYGGLVCRTRAIDDAVRAAVRRGVRDLVILGAGLDTRAYRLPELADLDVYELDLPGTSAFKQAQIRAALGALPVRVHYLPVDFNTERFSSVLRLADPAASRPRFFVWEGVSQYLQPPAAEAILREVASSPPGSGIVFTYTPQGVIDGTSARPDAQSLKRMAQRAGWLTGFDPERLEERLRDLGLQLVDDAGPREYQERYLAPMGRKLPVFELERLAQAQVPAPLG